MLYSLNMRKSLLVAAPILFLALILSSFTLGYKGAFADGGPNDECEDAQETSFVDGDEDEREYTDPDGDIITGVCIKSGSNMFGDGHSEALTSDGDYEDDCYTIEGIGTSTVTVTRNFDESNCQGISHLDIYTQVEEPTPTPTEEPSPTPTEEPSPSPTGEPEPTPTEVQEEPTPTPTEVPEEPTPTPTQEPTPTPTGTVAGTSTSNDTGDPGDSGQVQGQVLGASTLAATGAESESLITLGIILLGVALYGYAAPKVFA